MSKWAFRVCTAQRSTRTEKHSEWSEHRFASFLGPCDEEKERRPVFHLSSLSHLTCIPHTSTLQCVINPSLAQLPVPSSVLVRLNTSTDTVLHVTLQSDPTQSSCPTTTFSRQQALTLCNYICYFSRHSTTTAVHRPYRHTSGDRKPWFAGWGICIFSSLWPVPFSTLTGRDSRSA